MELAIISISVLVLAGIIIWKKSKNPYVYTNVFLKDIEIFLQVLLYRGYFGGYITLTDEQYNKSLIFMKYREKKKIGLNIYFPLDIDLAYNESNVEKLLKKQKLDFFIENTEDQKIHKFYVIDLWQDIEKIRKIAEALTQKLFEISSHEPMNLYLNGISPNEFIGFEEISISEEIKNNLLIPITKREHWSYTLGSFLGKFFRNIFK